MFQKRGDTAQRIVMHKHGVSQTRKKGKDLSQKKTPCGTEFSNLPADCQCTVCKWFVDGKRGCPCKKETDKNL